MANSLRLRLLCLALFATMAAATQFKVGGPQGWAVPSDPNAKSYNQWAEKRRFTAGDSLLFVYGPSNDSVLLVNEDAYKSCNTTSFIDQFADGNTVYTFTRAGTYYFISGNRDNCLKNESLAVKVMSDHSKGPSMPPSPSPVSSSPPSPPGVFSLTPASPPEEATGSHPKNGASLKAASLMGSIGVLVGSVLFAV